MLSVVNELLLGNIIDIICVKRLSHIVSILATKFDISAVESSGEFSWSSLASVAIGSCDIPPRRV